MHPGDRRVALARHAQADRNAARSLGIARLQLPCNFSQRPRLLSSAQVEKVDVSCKCSFNPVPSGGGHKVLSRHAQAVREAARAL